VRRERSNDPVSYAAIGPIVSYLPPRVETNEQLAREFPDWDIDLIAAKTGILQRHIADPDVCSSDLGVEAARRLFEQHQIDPASIDFLLFCTQTPDYPLPTTACLLQERLGLRHGCGAMDFNLGCSGFVYGLALAEGLIRLGLRRVLLITAETYSRYIDHADRSLRTIFGDGAAATLLEAGPEPTLEAFQFGTDGAGADTLLVTKGGCRPPQFAHQPRHRKRWNSDLYMDGPSLMNFTVGAIPQLVDDILGQAKLTMDQIRFCIMHQATLKMLEQLQQRLQLPSEAVPVALADCGNTVSSTIPILIERMRADGRLQPGVTSLLIGFGVGWSWAGCVWHERWSAYTPSRGGAL
jgi:3-oxoacyl-[acyl-carrier-protein] synthase III